MGIFISVQCSSNVRLDRKTAVITGANIGIGKATALDLYQRGARVILACRNLEKAEEAIDDIEKQCEHRKNVGKLEAVHLDLTSLESVRTCAAKLLEKEERIDLLINNAGVMMCPYSKTVDGNEMHFATNHLGHFLLTLLLIPKIIQSRPARIVNVSSRAHILTSSLNFSDLNWENRKYRSLAAYAESKLANILFTKSLAAKLQENKIEEVNVYSLHPGVIKTDLGRHVAKQIRLPGLTWIWETFGSYIVKNVNQGAQTQIYCAVHENCANETGLYYADCKVTKPSNAAENMESAEKLWAASLKMTGLEPNYNPFRLK